MGGMLGGGGTLKGGRPAGATGTPGAALARRAAGFARDYGAWRRGAAKGAKGANVGAAVTRPRQRAGERDGGAARVVARTDAGDLMVATASPRRQVGKATGEV